MELTRIHILCLFITIKLINGESLYYKTPKDRDPSTEIRGNSFGLENFLIQAYKEVDTAANDERFPVKQTVGRENVRNRETHSNRGQTYGLENLTPNLYELGRPQSGTPEYSSDFQPIINPAPEPPKPRAPDAVRQGGTRKEVRKQIRKQAKHPRKPVAESPKVTQPPVIPDVYKAQPVVVAVVNNEPKVPVTESQQQQVVINTEPEISTDAHITQAPEVGFTDSPVISNEKPSTEEAVTQVAEASFDAPKIQDVPMPEKESDETSQQNFRKRVTMRRRRKRPNQGSSQEKINQTTDSQPSRDASDAYDIQKVNDALTPSTTSATIIRVATEKERPPRKRPSGFRRVTQPILVTDNSPQIESTPKAETTTTEYVPDPQWNDTISSAAHTSEVFEKSEDFVSPTVPGFSSSEKTSAADLKTILKQQDGPLSLSELLQTKNLSLADFLKNRKEAASLLNGRKGISSTTPRTDGRQHNRPPNANLSSRSRPFSRSKQGTESEETRSNEQAQGEKSNYNGFVPKNPRLRYGHFKGAFPNIKSRPTSETNNETSATTGTRPDSPIRTTERTTVSAATTQQSNTTKRFNDLRTKLRMHRRKHPLSTTSRFNKDERAEASTEGTAASTVTQPTFEKSSTAEEFSTSKRANLRIPFKSSNNPELSVILPNKNKSEEKTEKRDRHSNFSSHLQIPKRFAQEKDGSRRRENSVSQAIPTIASTSAEENLPLDAIDIDDDQPLHYAEESNESFATPTEGSERIMENTKVEAVGKIPLSNGLQKYEAKDEILELLKTGSHSSESLHQILESRNMTVKELLENREKNSLQSNFSQLFGENDVALPGPKEIKPTKAPDSTLKVFQSLPNFQPIHKNPFQKNVKDLKTNSYSDDRAVENRKGHGRSGSDSTSYEARDSKQLGNRIMEVVKRKLHLNSDNQQREHLEGNDQWSSGDKFLFFGSSFPAVKEKPAPTVRSKPGNFLTRENSDDVEESDIILLETIKRSQEANRKLKSNINEILQEQSVVTDINNDKDKSLIPPAIKSAIIASGVVMGLALFVFVAIFAACGWKQRQIRLRARSSILNDPLAKPDSGKKIQRATALTPANFKQPSMYKKSLDLDDGSSSASASSNTSSYLWNTLKNTFSGRNTMLKTRLDKEDKVREERLDGLKSVLKNYETRRSDILVEEDANEERYPNSFTSQERYSVKNDCVKRSSSFKMNHYSNCTHGH